MILPSHIHVKLIDRNFTKIALGNIFFGLKMSNEKNSWKNINFIETDINGDLILSKEEILERIGKTYDLKEMAKQTKTPFEIYIYDASFLDEFINKMKNMIKGYGNQKKISEELFDAGLEVNKIEKSKEIISESFERDKYLYSRIINHKNGSINVVSSNKISGDWMDEAEKYYEFIIVTNYSM
jgi:hypothetical protein